MEQKLPPFFKKKYFLCFCADQRLHLGGGGKVYTSSNGLHVFSYGKGVLEGGEKRREEGKVNNSSKNAYRAKVVHSYQHSNLRS